MTDKAWEKFNEGFQKHGLPKIMSSDITVSILDAHDDDGLDAKQCAELGAMLFLDKPLILVCAPGATIPSRLRRAADFVVEDWNPEDRESQLRLEEAIEHMREIVEALNVEDEA